MNQRRHADSNAGKTPDEKSNQTTRPMTPEQKRIRIAEICGREHCPDCPNQGWFYVNRTGREDGEPDQEQCRWCETVEGSIFNSPNYLNDLNAMHEAVNGLSHDQRLKYRQCLQNMFTFSMHNPTPAIDAPASMRADAFLLAHGVEI